MASVGNTSSGSVIAASLTFSHTLSAGADYFAVQVGLIFGSSATVDTVTYNGVGLTQRISHEPGETGTPKAEIWDMPAADLPSEAAHDVVITLSTARALHGSALDMVGIDVVTPRGTSGTDNGSDASPSTVVTAATGDIVVDCCHVHSPATSPTGTVGSGQTEIANLSVNSSSRFLSSHEAGAASVTMSWSLTNQDGFSQVALVFKAAAAVSVSRLGLLGVG